MLLLAAFACCLLLGGQAVADALLVLPEEEAGRLDELDASAVEWEKQHKHCHDLTYGKHKNEFASPYEGLFIQERASKPLPGPGQHLNFGAVKPWPHILSKLDGHADRKLLILIRHGEAWSNYLEKVLGPDLWYGVESKCSFTIPNGTEYHVFDAELTPSGEDQARALNELLLAPGVGFDVVTGGRSARLLVSPLSRCLHTATLSLDGLQFNATNVEELCRETLGSDTCDARRSVSDHGGDLPDCGPCELDSGLKSKFPDYDFSVLGADKTGFGLFTDSDHLWHKHHREKQKKQVKRAVDFLHTVYDNAEEQVVFVVTHSGFIRSILLACDREPYRPQNAEVVPLLMEKRSRRESHE